MSTFDHAIQTLLWQAPEDDAGAAETISDTLKAKLEIEWAAFEAYCDSINFEPEAARASSYDPSEGDLWAYAAHDWILTRNGHGRGFWDGDWHEPAATLLTAFCKRQGQIDTYQEGNILCLF